MEAGEGDSGIQAQGIVQEALLHNSTVETGLGCLSVYKEVHFMREATTPVLLIYATTSVTVFPPRQPHMSMTLFRPPSLNLDSFQQSSTPLN